MSDNDIIKALECCIKCGQRQIANCNMCMLERTYPECDTEIEIMCLDLINRQKAEIERLQKRLEEEKHALFEQQAYTAELQKEIDATYKLLELKREEEQREHELKIDALKEINSLLPNAIYRAKADAIKEFAARIKVKRGARGELWESQIDNLVKEMTEGEDETD